MKKVIKYLLPLIFVAVLFGAAYIIIGLYNFGQSGIPVEEEGVSLRLAQHRKATIENLKYNLTFNLPKDKSLDVWAKEIISFDLKKRDHIVIDFREKEEKIQYVIANGDTITKIFENEHLYIPKKNIIKGENQIEIGFIAGKQSLNRRDNFIYTLFVPDRARTVFPCFEQPNLKAKFILTLIIPEEWKAVSNGVISEVKEMSSEEFVTQNIDAWKKITFSETEPLPTYLFAFAAGEFEYQEFTEKNRTIGVYYRETDPKRISQLPEIAHQVFFALDWQEEFTEVKYPFAKYDFVVLPGFQFGGMEHTGCTFYNDNTLFLAENPTPDELLRRTELIAHETTHMWFGDAVTMDWFNDVWTKEVFANYFAAEITEPLFPDIDHGLNWYKTYVSAAISQDRTEGRTSIRQPLDNMKNAGLIYNNIIYNKAPVMMRKMVELMGKEGFQRGIRKYVKQYLYGNATWDELIEILDAETDVDLKAFSLDWVDTANYPKYTATSYKDERIGKEYGYFKMTPSQCDSLMNTWQSEEKGARSQALLMTIYENYLNRNIDNESFIQMLLRDLKNETDPLTASTLISFLNEPLIQRLISKKSKANETPGYDKSILKLAETHPLTVVRTQLLRLLINRTESPEVINYLYNIWEKENSSYLSINDYINLAYELAVRLPEKADNIIERQRQRIKDADRLARFEFVARAVSPKEEDKDALFESLKMAENRRIEPWTQNVLYYLNHPSRDKESVKYIKPALELLPEIQRTGDIFFPQNWCSNLLSGHRSEEAKQVVQEFLDENEDMQPLLKNKIKTAAYYLLR